MNTILSASYDAPEISVKEILRYMGCKEATPDTKALIDISLIECKDIFSYNLVYTELPVNISDNTVTLGSISIKSSDLFKCLQGCKSAIVFAATVGLRIDRQIHKYSRISPSKALCLAAIGDERIEALCDSFCTDMAERYKEKGLILRPRFSPGYGDLDIKIQKEFFSLLDCERRLGLTLTNTNLMSPTKSVTAIIGIKQDKKEHECN